MKYSNLLMWGIFSTFIYENNARLTIKEITVINDIQGLQNYLSESKQNYIPLDDISSAHSTPAHTPTPSTTENDLIKTSTNPSSLIDPQTPPKTPPTHHKQHDISSLFLFDIDEVILQSGNVGYTHQCFNKIGYTVVEQMITDSVTTHLQKYEDAKNLFKHLKDKIYFNNSNTYNKSFTDYLYSKFTTLSNPRIAEPALLAFLKQITNNVIYISAAHKNCVNERRELFKQLDIPTKGSINGLYNTENNIELAYTSGNIYHAGSETIDGYTPKAYLVADIIRNNPDTSDFFMIDDQYKNLQDIKNLLNKQQDLEGTLHLIHYTYNNKAEQDLFDNSPAADSKEKLIIQFQELLNNAIDAIFTQYQTEADQLLKKAACFLPEDTVTISTYDPITGKVRHKTIPVTELQKHLRTLDTNNAVHSITL